MNTRKAQRALMEVAKREGKSVAEVRRDIQAIIDEAQKSTDPKAQEFWKSVPCRGEFPTPEEAITHIAKTAQWPRFMTSGQVGPKS